MNYYVYLVLLCKAESPVVPEAALCNDDITPHNTQNIVTDPTQCNSYHLNGRWSNIISGCCPTNKNCQGTSTQPFPNFKTGIDNPCIPKFQLIHFPISFLREKGQLERKETIKLLIYKIIFKHKQKYFWIHFQYHISV